MQLQNYRGTEEVSNTRQFLLPTATTSKEHAIRHKILSMQTNMWYSKFKF
jgi:hypothetical protein